MIDFAVDRFSLGNAVNYCYWVCGCRTGKTFASLAIIKEKNFKRTLVITKKAAIMDAWKRELTEFIDDIDYVLLEDRVETRGREHGKMTAKEKSAFLIQYLPSVGQVVVVLNYETALKIVDTLYAAHFDYVILDESHLIKAQDSVISNKLARQLKTVPNKLLMTGTGWHDKPTDVFGQVRFFLPYSAGKYLASTHLGTWGRFYDTYVDWWALDNIKMDRGYKNIDQLTTILNDFTLYVKTEDVIDLPPTNHLVYKLDMPKKMEKAYRELEAEMVTTFGDDLLIAGNKLTQGLRLHQLTSGYYQLFEQDPVEFVKPGENPKLQWLINMVEEAGGAPVVIYTRFKQDVALIYKTLTEMGIETLRLTGDVKEHVEWQKGKGQVLLCNISAGGTGVTLNRANLFVYYSVGFSNTEYEQSLWRGLDDTQKRPVFYHHLVMKDTIDEEIREALERKGNMADFILKKLTNRLTGAK
jgi:SNF2 family DNA or RNA helicase